MVAKEYYVLATTESNWLYKMGFLETAYIRDAYFVLENISELKDAMKEAIME